MTAVLQMRKGDILQLRHPSKASDSYYTYERVVQAGDIQLTPQKRKLPCSDLVIGTSANAHKPDKQSTSASPAAQKEHDLLKGCVVWFTSSMHTKALKTKLQVRYNQLLAHYSNVRYLVSYAALASSIHI